MNSSAVAIILLLVAVSSTAVMADSIQMETPPRPQISESFETKYLFYIGANMTASVSMIRDFKGGRQIVNLSYFDYDISRTEIFRADMNMTYLITWNETAGNMTCDKYEMPISLGMWWDWLQYARYYGRDEFSRTDSWNNESIYTGLIVPINNPNTPLVLSHFYEETALDIVFIGFNPMYIPVDSDFNVPDDCISKKVNKKQSFDDPFSHKIFAPEYLINRKFAAKLFPQGTDNEHFKRHRSMFGSRGKRPKM